MSIPTASSAARQGQVRPDRAHLVLLTALQLDVNRLHTLRAEGGREALRILLSARRKLTVAATGQINRLRALGVTTMAS